MSFHALRIACRNCGSSFLFGGGGASDMTFWKGCVASCRVCGAQTEASNAPTVTLSARDAVPVASPPNVSRRLLSPAS